MGLPEPAKLGGGLRGAVWRAPYSPGAVVTAVVIGTKGWGGWKRKGAGARVPELLHLLCSCLFQEGHDFNEGVRARK